MAHSLVTYLLCPYATPRILLNDNGAEFRNSILVGICNQFNIRQTFTVAYHLALNGLVRRANKKILDALHLVVNFLFANWEDWILQISASTDSSVSESTGKTSYYILYGVDKVFPMIYSLSRRSSSITLITTQNNNYMIREIGVFVGNLNLRRKSTTSTGTNMFISRRFDYLQVSSPVV